MAEVHSTYNKRRLEKLSRMFDGDPRKGNATLYVREHFNLKRLCENCGDRTANRGLAVASVIVEGPSWVLPISVRRDGHILIDLALSIPDQSNFLSDETTLGLEELGIVCNYYGQTEYVIPIAASRDEYYKTLRKNKRWDYKNAKKHFTCTVVTTASAADVLKWDTEVEYDYEEHLSATTYDRSCGFNVETEYFQWLAEHGRLVLARISDADDATLAIGYCVPEDYELAFVTLKRRSAVRYRKYGLGTALFFMLLDHIYDEGLLTPLNIRPVLYRHQIIWHPIQVAKPRLEFADPGALQTILDRFGTK